MKHKPKLFRRGLCDNDIFESLVNQSPKLHELPQWAKKNISKAELKRVAVIDCEVFRPLYVVKHPRHTLNNIMDHDTAQLFVDTFNKKHARSEDDRAHMVPMVFSANNNKTNRKANT